MSTYYGWPSFRHSPPVRHSTKYNKISLFYFTHRITCITPLSLKLNEWKRYSSSRDPEMTFVTPTHAKVTPHCLLRTCDEAEFQTRPAVEATASTARDTFTCLHTEMVNGVYRGVTVVCVGTSKNTRKTWGSCRSLRPPSEDDPHYPRWSMLREGLIGKGSTRIGTTT